ncbi:uncharacterized protein LOC143915394 [Arctopsyche grandis]|uniref:uncharacterized protein LOC143915394 n=1 Tax=Arctopsyche grandis TaxID=121162 RepID=UPI00406D8169
MGDSLLISEKECQILVEIVLGLPKKCLLTYNLTRMGDSPLGFLGDHFQLIINLNQDCEGNKQRVLSFFVKTTPSIKTHSDYVENIGAFQKEINLFQELMPQLQKTTSFLECQWSPKCYLVKENALVFENLSNSNYRMADGRGLLDLKHCIAVTKTLADFHAASILWEHEKKASINENYPHLVKEVAYVLEEGHVRNMWLKSGTDALVYLCSKIKRENKASAIPSKIRKAVANVGAIHKSCNVLSHGDLWANNLMFQYNNNNEVVHCVLVDFQLIRYAPCALDLMCCLHLIASQTLRDQHLIHLINIYFDHLSNLIRSRGFNPEEIIPKSTFIQDCDRYKQTALAEACLFGLTIWLPSSLTGKILSSPTQCQQLVTGDKSSIIEKAFCEDDFFRNQISSVLHEFLDI